MTHPPELREQAEALRKQGLLIREVAAALGVPKPTVTRWLNSEIEDRGRERARQYKMSSSCPNCGKPMSRTAKLCLACEKEAHLAGRPWNQGRVIAAMQAWADEHGHAPTEEEWAHSGGEKYPAASSIRTGPNPIFKSWGEAVRAAGFTPRERRTNRVILTKKRHEVERDTREQMIKKALKKGDGK